MERGLRAELSPNEDAALQRIAVGEQTGLRPDYVERLKLLALVEPCDNGLVLTALGVRRIEERQSSC